MMRISRICIILIALWFENGMAQTLFQQKTLAFGQLAVGDVIDTTLTVTNRGSGEYQATLFLYRQEGLQWNPVVNGSAVENGALPVTLTSGQTVTLHFTGDELAEGFGILVPTGFQQDNFVEGNLTYRIFSGGNVEDAIGVLPSQEFYLATLPFNNFPAVALSLINPDVVNNASANVTLALFDESGQMVAETSRVLAPLEHDPALLPEFFPEGGPAGGRLDIRSDIPIFGTALTVASGQISALPLSGAVRAYAVELIDGAMIVSRGGASLWVDGQFVRGYMVINEVAGDAIAAQTYLLYGRLVRGVLRLSFFGRGPTFENRDVNVYVEDFRFSLDDALASNSYVAVFLDDNTVSTGTLIFNRAN